MNIVQTFQAKLTPEQSGTLENWLIATRWVWNHGISLLREHEDCTGDKYDIFTEANGETKKQKAHYPACKLRKTYARNVDDDDKITWGWCSHIIPRDKNGGTVDLWTGQPTHHLPKEGQTLIRVGYSCPIPGAHGRAPRIGYAVLGKFSLQYYFVKKNLRTLGLRPELLSLIEDIPAWFIRGACSDLWQAWSAYKAGRMGIPKFKSLDDLSESLTNENGVDFSVKPADNNKDGLLRCVGLGDILVKDLWKDWGECPISVFQLVRRQDEWRVHLTRIVLHDVDARNLVMQALVASHKAVLSAKLALLFLNQRTWRKRTAITRLTIPGSGYVVAVDDRGKEYNVLPKRREDGAIDPHGLIAKMQARILHLQRAAAKRAEVLKADKASGNTENRGRRLAATYREIARLRREIAVILSNNRKKMAHFISERSLEVEITVKSETQKRQPKPKKKPTKGSIDPATYDPNGAKQVSERNRATAGSAPGEFRALLQREGEQRTQIIKVIQVASQKTKKSKKQVDKRKKP